jgi:hypothetical protein
MEAGQAQISDSKRGARGLPFSSVGRFNFAAEIFYLLVDLTILFNSLFHAVDGVQGGRMVTIEAPANRLY